MSRIADAASDNPLELRAILRSVSRHQPQVQRALLQTAAARARLTAAEGGFDPVVSANASRRTGGGFYDLIRGGVQIRQATSLWGAEVYGGYRIGLGLDDDESYPSYYGDETLSGGELSIGVSLPIWRDGPIDARRAAIAQAGDRVASARAYAADTTFQMNVAASRSYYKWVAAGHRLLVAERQLELAQVRDAQLRQREAAGSAAAFDVTDNLRQVVSREDQLIASRRSFEAAGIELSLFLRNESGETQVAEMDRLASLPTPPEGAQAVTAADVGRVVACHPRVRRLEAELRVKETAFELARNRVAPDARASLQLSRDLGPSSRDQTLPGTVLELGFKLSMPLLLRRDRGAAAAAAAAVEQQEVEIAFAKDRLRTAVQNAVSRVKAAVERAAVSAQLVATSEALAAGERQRLDAGSGTLLFVNLREVAAADAANRYIRALAEAHAAYFEWETWLAISCPG